MTFYERKAERKEHYKNNVEGWKLETCGCCSGSGHYDVSGSPECGNCEGTGKTRVPPKQKEEE